MRGAGRHPTGVTHSHFSGDFSHLQDVTRMRDSVCDASPACEIQCAMRHPHARFSVRCVTRMRGVTPLACDMSHSGVG